MLQRRHHLARLGDAGQIQVGGDEADILAGIVVTNYLHRPLRPILAEALAPGGVLIYETFAVGQGQFGRPSAENYLLRPNELIRGYAPLLTIVGFEHGIDYAPGPKAVQRLAAVKGRDLVPL